MLYEVITYFGDTLAAPEKPFVAILGGAKVSDKIMVIDNLLEKVDTIIIGGAMAYTMLKAKGEDTGISLVEEDKLDIAREIFRKGEEKGVQVLIPVDHVCAKEFSSEESDGTFATIPADMMGLDIGPKSIELFSNAIKAAKTVRNNFV